MAAMTEEAKKKKLQTELVKRITQRELEATGSQLYQDPFTGFLGFIPNLNSGKSPAELLEAYKQGGTDPFRGFTPANKLEFIELLPKHWPNMSKTLKSMEHGCDRNTLQRHIESDMVFHERVKNIEREMVDELKSDIRKFGKRPKNFMDRMALGRLYAPEEFDPARRLIVENRKVSDTRGEQGRLVKLQDCVDAELAPSPAPAQIDATPKP